MRRTLATIVFVILLAPAAFAADKISFTPAQPTPETPVTLKVRTIWKDGCLPRDPQVMKTGNNITVTFRIPPDIGCTLALMPWSADVSLGLVTAGGHQVTVNVIEQDGRVTLLEQKLLVVFDSFRMNVSPTTIPTTGGTEISIGLESTAVCPTPPVCSELVFAIDDVVLEPTNAICCILGYGVTAPPHAPGAALLTVRDKATGALIASAVLRYFDPQDTTDDELFERVLIPIIFSGPGAHGAQWVTDVSLLNRNGFTLNVANRNVDKLSVVDLSSENRPGGWVLNVLREAANRIHFGVLVRDLSRQGEALGTEIPVVRENEFYTSEFFMLNVPIDSRSRQTLRIYAIGVDSARAQLNINPMAQMGRGIHTFIDLRGGNVATGTPAYAEVELSSQFPELLGAGPYRVELIVSSGLTNVPAWAFVSVANNTTQHVTVVSPQ